MDQTETERLRGQLEEERKSELKFGLAAERVRESLRDLGRAIIGTWDHTEYTFFVERACESFKLGDADEFAYNVGKGISILVSEENDRRKEEEKDASDKDKTIENMKDEILGLKNRLENET